VAAGGRVGVGLEDLLGGVVDEVAVVAVATGEGVDAGTAVEGVGTAASGQGVGAFAAVEPVVAEEVNELVITFAAELGVVAGSAVEGVGPGFAV